MAKQQRWGRGREPVEQPTGEPVEARPPAPREAAAPPAPADPDGPVDAAPPVPRSTAGPTTVTQPAAPTDPPSPAGRTLRRRLLDSGPVTLLVAAHPVQAALTALGVGGAALAADRPAREAAVVAATVLVGQTILGWHNDIVDRDRDARHGLPRKPVADGRLEPGSVWYAVVIAVLLVVPLSISTGVTAGTCYLASLAVGLLGNVLLRDGLISWLPWAVSYGLYPAYLSLGGWGGSAEGAAPEPAMVVLAGLLGVGVHVVRSVWGLVPDHTDGWRHLPLRLGRRIGATRLLVLGGTWTAAVVVAIVVVGTRVGLRQ